MAPAAKESESKDEVKVTKSEKRKKSEGTSKSEKTEQPREKLIKKEKEKEKEVVTPTVDIYDQILTLENEESETRSGDNDLNMWKNICGELRGLMKDIFEMKIKGGSQTDIAEKRIQATLLFVTLKKLNRIEKLRLKKNRDSTNQAKQSMDSFNLQLQNLLYEVLHLKKEVTKCINFKSADDNLSLVPTEEFYSEAPESISKSDITMADPHAQRLARLEWELKRRKDLGKEVEERETDRDKVELVIRTREDKLRDLGPQLSKILDTTIPVQKYLELPLTDTRDQLELARQLPSPLYVMYAQCSAYSQACDPLLVVRVVGDGEEARRFQEMMDKESQEDEEGEEPGKDDSQDPDTETDKTRRGKNKTTADKSVKIHPLKVELKILVDEVTSVTVSCSWCLTLEIVSCSVKLEMPGSCSGDLVTADTILAHLSPGDTGLTSPNPATSWQLSQLGLGDSLEKLLPGELLYHWCQRLAGLDYLEAKKGKDSSNGSLEAKPEVSKLYIENTINTIRTRLGARIALTKQMESLAKCKVDTGKASEEAKLPTRAVSRLKSWQTLDWETYNLQEFSKHLVDTEMVHSDCFLYKANITRDKAVMTALVSVSPSHPSTPPLWCLSLKVGDAQQTQESSEVIRDLERELNLPEVELSLTTAVHKLLLLTDVVLEVSSAEEAAGEKFMKSQVFLDNVRGRMRRLPLVFNTSQQMFQQR